MRIENGQYVAGEFQERWNLLDYGSNRGFRENISFSQPFATPPKVIVALSGFNFRNDTPDVNLRAERITENGFEIRISSTGGGVREVAVSWLAIGT